MLKRNSNSINFHTMYVGVSKNRGKNPKMDGLFHGKPYEQMDDLGGFPIIFGTTLLFHSRNCHQKPEDPVLNGCFGLPLVGSAGTRSNKNGIGDVDPSCCTIGRSGGKLRKLKRDHF